MVRTYQQAGVIYKIMNFFRLIWEILMLFIASLFVKDPKTVDKKDATPFRTYNSGRGGPGGGSGGGGGGGPPGRNIRGLNHNRGSNMRVPMGGGG